MAETTCYRCSCYSGPSLSFQFFPGIYQLLTSRQVGPAGQSATAFLVLGTAAGQKMRFAEYARGTFFTQEVGQVFYGASFLLGFLLIGLAIFWMIIALYGVVDLAFVRREFTYTL